MKPLRQFLPVCLACGLAALAPAAEPPAVPLPSTSAAGAPNLSITPGAMPLPAAPLSAVEREAAVELPPMIVAESAKAPPWLYARVGDTEYLSRCSVSTTKAYITAQLEIRQMLRVFMPADFFATSAV